MNRKALIILLAFCMILALSVPVVAEETFTYKVSCSAETPAAGDEFDIVVSLSNYGSLDAELRGVQVDITNIDTSVFEIVSHESLIVDETAMSNKTSYVASAKRIRLVYANMSDVLDKSTNDVMKIRLKVKESITQDGTITLPVSIKLVKSPSGNITLSGSLTINYVLKPAEVIKVEIVWGALEFLYDDGVWDSESHKWTGSGWKPAAENGNLISVKNTGNTDVKMKLNYTPAETYSDLTGSFTDTSGGTASSPVDLPAEGAEQQYWFHLSGITEPRWTNEYVFLGNITITITE